MLPWREYPQPRYVPSLYIAVGAALGWSLVGSGDVSTGWETGSAGVSTTTGVTTAFSATAGIEIVGSLVGVGTAGALGAGALAGVGVIGVGDGGVNVDAGAAATIGAGVRRCAICCANRSAAGDVRSYPAA